ncbi:MAG: hypothetical protein WA210_11525 [Burkholderiaceae bacterium]
MNAISVATAAAQEQRSLRSRTSSGEASSAASGEFFVYAWLALLTLAAWLISRTGLYTSGDDVGYWLGVAGSVMMLTVLIYPVRKYVPVFRNWGRVRFWLWFHMVLGAGGPLLILAHSTFRVGSLNAGVALFTMLIVAVSGIVGGFIYRRVHGGLDGKRGDLRELQVRAGFDQSEAVSKLKFAPDVEKRLQAFEQHELRAAPTWVTHLRQITWLPMKMWFTYWICAYQLRKPLRKIAAHKGWDRGALHQRQRLARKLVRRYLSAVVRVAHYTAYERVLALWHVVHIPFFYLLLVSAIVHVVAVHVY